MSHERGGMGSVPRTPSPGGALTIDVIAIDARLLDAARDAFESRRGRGAESLHAAIRDALLEHLAGALGSVPPADLRAHASAGADAVMARLATERPGVRHSGRGSVSKPRVGQRATSRLGGKEVEAGGFDAADADRRSSRAVTSLDASEVLRQNRITAAKGAVS